MKTDNELIAEFMGMRHQKQVGPFGGEYLYVQDPITREWQSPKYNTSWDWLMPVVEKIESFEEIKTKMEDSRFRICYLKKRFSCHTISKINSTYRVVVEFIKWYNQQKSQETCIQT